MTEPTARPIIMVADDDADDRLMITDAFAEGPIECTMRFAQNGAQLLHILSEENHPDLIILDLNMPVKDGRETLLAIKANSDLKQIPTVVMTTSGDQDDVHYCYSHGANSYIVKPTSYSDLLSIVASLKSYWIDTVNLPKRSEKYD